MNRIHIGRPGARSGRPCSGALSPNPPDPASAQAAGVRADHAFRTAARYTMAWAGRCLWLAVRPVISAARMALHEQVRMWECVLLTSGTVPLSAVGPLRWVRSIDGYRLEGSHLQAQDPAETGR
jgi:hypothetical protein